jgi:hypothetical protein
MNSHDPWRTLDSSPYGEMAIPAPQLYGYNLRVGAEAPQRTGLTAELAPVLAPATGGFTVKIDLDPQQRLHASICVDGKCYQTSIDLAPAIAAVMAKIAQAHAEMHAAMPHVPVISGDVAIGAVDEAVGAAGEALIDTLLDRHISVACAGFLDDIGNALSGAGGAVFGAVQDTVKALKGPITAAATVAATAIPGVGPIVAPMAAKLVGPIIDTATSLGKPHPAVAAAQQQAQTDPQVAQALAAAQTAAAHTIAAFHVTRTAQQAAAGHPAAQQQIAQVVQDAEQGDPAAHAVTPLVENAFSTAGQDRKRGGHRHHHHHRQDPDTAPPSPVSGIGVWQDLVGADAFDALPNASMDQYRRAAIEAVRRAYRQRRAPLLGYHRAGNKQRVFLFDSLRDATAWYQHPTSGYSYAAIFDANDTRSPLAEDFSEVFFAAYPATA